MGTGVDSQVGQSPSQLRKDLPGAVHLTPELHTAPATVTTLPGFIVQGLAVCLLGG